MVYTKSVSFDSLILIAHFGGIKAYFIAAKKVYYIEVIFSLETNRCNSLSLAPNHWDAFTGIRLDGTKSRVDALRELCNNLSNWFDYDKNVEWIWVDAERKNKDDWFDVV